jgi:Predicted hydrolase (metallo-beta-lactamase superfamily)
MSFRSIYILCTIIICSATNVFATSAEILPIVPQPAHTVVSGTSVSLSKNWDIYIHPGSGIDNEYIASILRELDINTDFTGKKNDDVLIDTKISKNPEAYHGSVSENRRTRFSLPSFSKKDDTFTLWQLPSQINTIGNSYVIRTGNGKVIVMDGGVTEEEGYLRGFLGALGNTVDCWFVTHPHPDHIGAFTRILENPMDIKIHQICQSTFSDELLAREPDYKDEAIRYYEAAKKSGVEIIEGTLGMTYTFGYTTFKILGIKNEELTANPYNNSSMVIKVWDPVKSVLFLADAGAEAGDKLLNGPYRKELDCDYMQMAHHGQNGVTMDFYRAVKFRACLWPTPSWVYNNDVGGGFNTHTLTTIETRNTVDSLNITEHYLSFQGLIKIE